MNRKVFLELRILLYGSSSLESGQETSAPKRAIDTTLEPRGKQELLAPRLAPFM